MGVAHIEKQNDDWKPWMDLVNVNINAQTFMTHFLLPWMLEREGVRSAIINLSSVAHYEKVPFLAMYSASKSYNYMFSENLSASYSDKIDVLTVTPAGTYSKMYTSDFSFSIPADIHGKAVID